MLKLEYYPESEVLVSKAETVTWFDKDLIHFSHEMIETMWANDGVGLAAPQVGVSKRLIVANLMGSDASVLVNPRIIFQSEDKEWGEEGCLSLPGLYAPVQRSIRVTVEFETLKAVTHRITMANRAARVLQHEIDHLDGWLFPFYAIKNAVKGMFNPLIVKPFDYDKLARLEAVRI